MRPDTAQSSRLQPHPVDVCEKVFYIKSLQHLGLGISLDTHISTFSLLKIRLAKFAMASSAPAIMLRS